MKNRLDPRYQLLHKRVKTSKGDGVVVQVLEKISVLLDEPRYNTRKKKMEKVVLKFDDDDVREVQSEQ